MYQKAIKDQDFLYVKNEGKILKHKGDLQQVREVEKIGQLLLRVGTKSGPFWIGDQEVEVAMNSLRDQITTMKGHMSSLYELVEMLKVEFTKAYRNRVSFMVSSLKTRG